MSSAPPQPPQPPPPPPVPAVNSSTSSTASPAPSSSSGSISSGYELVQTPSTGASLQTGSATAASHNDPSSSAPRSAGFSSHPLVRSIEASPPLNAAAPTMQPPPTRSQPSMQHTKRLMQRESAPLSYDPTSSPTTTTQYTQSSDTLHGNQGPRRGSLLQLQQTPRSSIVGHGDGSGTGSGSGINSAKNTLKKSNSVPSVTSLKAAVSSSATSVINTTIAVVDSLESAETRILAITRGHSTPKGPTVEDWRLTTQDYDDINDLRFDVEQESSSKCDSFIATLLKFSMTVMIALVTALAMWGVREIVDLALTRRNDATLDLIENSADAAAFFQMFFASIGMCSFAAFLCVYIAPNARGGGVPYVQAYLNGTNVNEFFGWRIVGVKIVSLALVVAGGLTVGREGPFVYLGGGIAMICCKIVDWLTLNRRGRWARSIRNIKEERIFIAGGMAAGLAVAFSAPIAGVLLAMEGTTSFLTQLVLLRIFCCSMFGMLFSDLTYANWDYHIKNHNLILVKADEILEFNYMVSEVIAFIVIGVIGGALGALATYANVKVTKWRHSMHMERRTLFAIAEVAIIAGATVVLFFILPYTFGCRPLHSDCAPSPQIEVKCRQTQCPEGYYSDIGSLVYSTSDQIAAQLFDRSRDLENDFGMAGLLTYGAIYFVLVVWVYGAMVPGGLFVPSIIIGGVYGRVIGIMSEQVSSSINPGVYALLGSAAMLGGFTRLALPVIVMLIEMTGDATYLLPVMLCCVVGKSVADHLTTPLYPQHMAIENIPVLTDKLNDAVSTLQAVDIMNKTFASICRYDTLEHILDTLDRSKSVVLPVTNLDGTFYGVIKRTQLIVAMKYGELHDSVQDAITAHKLATGQTPKNTSNASTLSNSSSKVSQANKKPVKLDKRLRQLDWADVNDYTATLDELDKGMDNKIMDLSRYVDSGVLAVHEQTSSKRCAALFRKLGVSHLMVTDVRHKLVGVITRRNLIAAPEKAASTAPAASTDVLPPTDDSSMMDSGELLAQPLESARDRAESHVTSDDSLGGNPGFSIQLNDATATANQLQGSGASTQSTNRHRRSHTLARVQGYLESLPTAAE